MKKLFLTLLLILLLAACSPAAPVETAIAPVTGLRISGGGSPTTLTLADLQALEPSQAEFKGVTYVGARLAAVLEAAGYDPAQIKAVKAVATDGFSANYEPELFLRDDTVVAYALPDGPLTEEDGAFRMVLPDQEGRLNVRQLVELQVIQ